MTLDRTPDIQIDAPARTAGSAAPRGLGLAALGLAVLLAVPFFLVDVPPVLDYPNHLARFLILAHPADPALARMFAPHWTLLPDLGGDVLGMLLLKVAPVHVGGRLILALSLYAPVLGAALYHRIAFGRWSWWVLGVGLCAYNGVFFMGFMNFLIALGLAFAGAAGWLALRRRGRIWAAAALGAAAMAGLFLCHILGVAVMALLIGTQEVERLVGLWRGRSRPPWAEAARAAGLLSLALAPAVVLYLACRTSAPSSGLPDWDLAHKPLELFAAFMTYSKSLTLITGAAVLAVVILTWRGARLAPGAGLALAGAALVFALAPVQVQGGTFLDLRFGLVLGLLLFACVQPAIPARHAVACGLLLSVLIVARTVYVAGCWIDHRQDLAGMRAAIAPLPPGARVLLARGPGAGAPAERRLPDLYPLDSHVAALVVIERRAFWPLIFADPSQQPLTVRPPYAALTARLSDPVDWSVLGQGRPSAAVIAAAPYLADWRGSFDYVLLIDAEGAGPPPSGLTPAYLAPAHLGGYARLYRIARGA